MRDEDLVRRYLAGDAEAFVTLVHRHEARIFNVCLRIVANRDDAADAAQETFLAALRKLTQFRGDAAFTTWLHRIAVNACYDLLRRQRRQPLLRLAIEVGDTDPDTGPPMPDHADEVVGTRDMAEALAGVPDEFRVALVLADVEDLPYEEIAKILDVPLGTVKSRVHRGRLALARTVQLRRREPDPVSRTSEEET